MEKRAVPKESYARRSIKRAAKDSWDLLGVDHPMRLLLTIPVWLMTVLIVRYLGSPDEMESALWWAAAALIAAAIMFVPLFFYRLAFSNPAKLEKEAWKAVRDLEKERDAANERVRKRATADGMREARCAVRRASLQSVADQIQSIVFPPAGASTDEWMAAASQLRMCQRLAVRAIREAHKSGDLYSPIPNVEKALGGGDDIAVFQLLAAATIWPEIPRQGDFGRRGKEFIEYHFNEVTQQTKVYVLAIINAIIVRCLTPEHADASPASLTSEASLPASPLQPPPSSPPRSSTSGA